MQRTDVNIKDILMAQNKDEEAMANIINNNSGLIWSIVKRFLGRGYLRRGVISDRLYRIYKIHTAF